ncbi:unnamed protein product [Didymodactylos carnosus]|nr:unnamed protein product [Didymodactylos carnosus]CAF3842186.1 unnamed protein product [Didymodactylos carnosus]
MVRLSDLPETVYPSQSYLLAATDHSLYSSLQGTMESSVDPWLNINGGGGGHYNPYSYDHAALAGYPYGPG